jgi:hypothetical protein
VTEVIPETLTKNKMQYSASPEADNRGSDLSGGGLILSQNCRRKTRDLPQAKTKSLYDDGNWGARTDRYGCTRGIRIRSHPIAVRILSRRNNRNRA